MILLYCSASFLHFENLSPEVLAVLDFLFFVRVHLIRDLLFLDNMVRRVSHHKRLSELWGFQVCFLQRFLRERKGDVRMQVFECLNVYVRVPSNRHKVSGCL